MSTRPHQEDVYRTKPCDRVRWLQVLAQTSLELIRTTATVA